MQRATQCHVRSMDSYTVTAQTNQKGFNVAIAGSDGTHCTTLGFTGEPAARE